jgi:transposase
VPKAGTKKIANYGDRFKATAAKLSSLPGVLLRNVTAAPDVHPLMRSLWRKQVREGGDCGPGVDLIARSQSSPTPTRIRLPTNSGTSN